MAGGKFSSRVQTTVRTSYAPKVYHVMRVQLTGEDPPRTAVALDYVILYGVSKVERAR